MAVSRNWVFSAFFQLSTRPSTSWSTARSAPSSGKRVVSSWSGSGGSWPGGLQSERLESNSRPSRPRWPRFPGRRFSDTTSEENSQEMLLLFLEPFKSRCSKKSYFVKIILQFILTFSLLAQVCFVITVVNVAENQGTFKHKSTIFAISCCVL